MDLEHTFFHVPVDHGGGGLAFIKGGIIVEDSKSLEVETDLVAEIAAVNVARCVQSPCMGRHLALI